MAEAADLSRYSDLRRAPASAATIQRSLPGQHPVKLVVDEPYSSPNSKNIRLLPGAPRSTLLLPGLPKRHPVMIIVLSLRGHPRSRLAVALAAPIR